MFGLFYYLFVLIFLNKLEYLSADVLPFLILFFLLLDSFSVSSFESVVTGLIKRINKYKYINIKNSLIYLINY
jgi:hypothetical protein